MHTGSGVEHFDAVISTSSPQIVRLAPDLPEAYSQQLGALKSMGAVVVILASSGSC